MPLNTALKVTIEMVAKAKPEPGQSLEDLERKVVGAGNVVLERVPGGLIIGRAKSTQIFRQEVQDG